MFGDYDDLLTIDETCELLKAGKNTVYKLLNSGELKGFRCGRNWRITKLAVEEYILRNSKLSGEKPAKRTRGERT